MNQRTRLAGLFALVAMTFALAEAVWAATCVPGMAMDAPAATVAEQVPSHDCMFAVVHDRESDQDRDHEKGGEDERQCPFSPAAAQTCAGVASLPSHAVDVVAPSPEVVTGAFFELTQHDLLLNDALFHPPRA